MRLSELLNAEVEDRHGRRIGRVYDTRLVQDGPVLGTWGAALRVHGLIVSRRHLFARLGLHRDEVVGPRLLKAVARRLQRDARLVPWDAVESVGAGRVTLKVAAEEIPPLVQDRGP